MALETTELKLGLDRVSEVCPTMPSDVLPAEEPNMGGTAGHVIPELHVSGFMNWHMSAGSNGGESISLDHHF